MPKETNAFTSYEAVGNKEDVSKIIFNTDPHETPLLDGIKKTKAIATNHEWQTDTLDPPSADNAREQGAPYSPDAITPTVCLSNHTQISDKEFRITGTQEAVKSYGRESEEDYQTILKGKALKNDMESTLLRLYA